jgi:hypothetical protein
VLRAFAALVAALAWSTVSTLAHAADAKEACIAASEEAQQLRIDGKPVEARARFLDCVKPECPTLVRQDCTQWTAEVVAAVPSVVLGARDPQGRDVIDVQASMDGVLVARRLDGRSLDVDPGVHVFRFESTVTREVSADLRVLVRAGEKNRVITVTLGVPAPAAGAASPPPSASGPSAGAPALAWVFGGIALAALGTALAFDVAQAVEYSHLDATCGGHCTAGEVSPVTTERWVAGIAAGVGALSLGTSVYFFLARPSSPGAATMGGVVGRF